MARDDTKPSTFWPRETLRCGRSRTARSPGSSSARPAGPPSTSSTPPPHFCYYYAHLERYADGLREGRTRAQGPDHRLRRHFWQCPKNDPSPALCHFPTDRSQALVGRHPDRPLRRPPVSFRQTPAGPSNLSRRLRPSKLMQERSLGACGTMTVTQAAVLLPEAEAPPACRRVSPLRSEGSSPGHQWARTATTDYVANAAAGDVSAFEHLYHTHLPRVHSLVRRMSGGRDADELTQDVFVRVWQKLGSFRGDSAFATWLHRLAVNVVIERFRQDTTRRQRMHDGEEIFETLSAPVRSRDFPMDFEAALQSAARRRPRDFRAPRRRGLQAPRDRHAARNFRRDVEGATPPRPDDAAAVSEQRALGAEQRLQGHDGDHGYRRPVHRSSLRLSRRRRAERRRPGRDRVASRHVHGVPDDARRARGRRRPRPVAARHGSGRGSLGRVSRPG